MQINGNAWQTPAFFPRKTGKIPLANYFGKCYTDFTFTGCEKEEYSVSAHFRERMNGANPRGQRRKAPLSCGSNGMNIPSRRRRVLPLQRLRVREQSRIQVVPRTDGTCSP